MDLKLELQDRLVKWSWWIIPFQKNEVGYPSKSTIADFGLPNAFTRQSKPPFPLNRLEAQEMNHWVNLMGQDHSNYKAVINAYYLRSDGLKIPDLAKNMSMSVSYFNQTLRKAREWLMRRLSLSKG